MLKLEPERFINLFIILSGGICPTQRYLCCLKLFRDDDAAEDAECL